jgi:F0F1-type ATP synthase assembly protein I
MPRTSDPKSSGWSGFDQGLAILGELISAVVVWGGAGWGLDHLFHTGHVLMLCGVGLGYGVWVYITYKRSTGAMPARRGDPKS